MNGAIAKAEQIAAATQGAFILQQFSNSDNPMAHRCVLGTMHHHPTLTLVGALFCIQMRNYALLFNLHKLLSLHGYDLPVMLIPLSLEMLNNKQGDDWAGDLVPDQR